MSQLLPTLYIGGIKEAQNKNWLNKRNIKYIINCATEVPNFHRGIHYLNLNLNDIPSQYIINRLEPSFRFYQQNYKKGNILVHCYAGVSRSSTIAMYILMRLGKWHWSQALTYLKTRHPRTQPNPGFLHQISQLGGK